MNEKHVFNIGDIIKVHYKIKEGGKERVQPFEGTVIAKRGAGISRTFTVRKIGNAKIGIERVFPFHSPNIDKVEVIKSQKVRRAKLYYMRDPKFK